MDFNKEFQMKDGKYRSSTLTNGLGRSGQRALLYATGMDEEDLKKPFVAVIGSFSEMVPGHTHMRELAEYVKQGIIEAGGVPRQSETICICDGLCQGHKGMRYPLASRDLIADSVEMVVEAHHFDAMVLLAGCDKIIPGMIMAAARLDIPAVIVPGGPMLPGNVGGNPLFCSSELREYPGRVETGAVTAEEMKAAEMAALPTVGSCAHLGTANSMCMLSEVLGMALPGAGTAFAASNKRKRIAKASGRAVMELLKEGITPRKILTRKTLLNGVAGAMARIVLKRAVSNRIKGAKPASWKIRFPDPGRVEPLKIRAKGSFARERISSRGKGRFSAGTARRQAGCAAGRAKRISSLWSTWYSSAVFWCWHKVINPRSSWPSAIMDCCRSTFTSWTQIVIPGYCLWNRGYR